MPASGDARDDLRVVSEMNQRAWLLLKRALEDVSSDEIDWRPVPQANSINVIVRHLRLEAEWHLDSLKRGEAMPSEISPARQKELDAVPLDFPRNREQLEALFTEFLDILRKTTRRMLEQRTSSAYGSAAKTRGSAHLLGYHQALHVATHCGQIFMIRNLYRTTRGEPARFFPKNPTYPR